MAGNEIISRIVFKVDGVDVFRNMFVKPAKDLDSMVNNWSRLAKTKIGGTFNGEKVTAEAKKGAQATLRYLKEIQKEYGKLGNLGHFKEIGGSLGIGKNGSLGVNSRYQKILKADPLSKSGKSQQQELVSIQRSLTLELAKAMRKIRMDFARIPATVDAKKAKKQIMDALNKTVTDAVADTNKALKGGKMTTAYAQKVWDKVMGKIANSEMKSSVTVGKMRSTSTMIAQMMKKVEMTIARQVNSATIEGTKKAYKKPYMDEFVTNLEQLGKELTATIKGAKGKSLTQLKKFKDELDMTLENRVAGLKGQTAEKMKKEHAGMWSNRASLQSVLALGGGLGVQLGDGIIQSVQSTHFKGRLAGSLNSVFSSVMYASAQQIFLEVTNILANVVEMVAESFLEIGRVIAVGVGGAIKGIGMALLQGAVTTFLLAAEGIAGTLMGAVAGAFSGGWGLVIVGAFAAVKMLMSIFSEFTTFLRGIFENIGNIIASTLKAGIMIVVEVIKGFGVTCKAIFNGIVDVAKASFNGLWEFLKAGFSATTEIAKNALEEYAKTSEYARRTFKEVIDVPGESPDKYQQMMLGLRAKTGLKREDVGEATFDIVSSGFRDFATASEIAAKSAQLAVQSESDMFTATNAMVTAFQNFSTHGETADSIMRSLAISCTLGRMTMQEYGTAMKSVLGTASRANLSFKDTVLALSMMTRVFGRGSIEEGTAYFNRFLEAIMMPSSRASQDVRSLGIEMEGLGKSAHFIDNVYGIVKKLDKMELKDIRKIFTTIQSRRAWLGLTQDMEQYMKMYGDFDSLMGYTQKQFEEMLNTPLRLYKKLQSATEVTFAVIGDAIWRGIGESVSIASKSIENFATMISGPAGMKVVKAFGEWFKPISNAVLGPLSNIINEITALMSRGAGGEQFASMFKTEGAMKLQGIIVKVVEFLWQIPGAITKIIAGTDFIMAKWNWFKGIVADVMTYFTNNSVATWIADLVNGIAKVGATMSALFTSKEGLMAFNSIINEIFSMIVEVFKQIGNMLMQVFPPIFDALMAIIGQKITNGIVDAFLLGIEKVVSFISGDGMLSRAFETAFGSMGIMDAIGNQVAKLRDEITVSKNLGGNVRYDNRYDLGGAVSGMIPKPSSIMSGLSGMPVIGPALAGLNVLQGAGKAGMSFANAGYSQAVGGGFSTENDEQVKLLFDLVRNTSFLKDLKNAPQSDVYMSDLIKGLTEMQSPEDMKKLLEDFDRLGTMFAGVGLSSKPELMAKQFPNMSLGSTRIMGELFKGLGGKYNDRKRIQGYATSAELGFKSMDFKSPFNNIAKAITEHVGAVNETIKGLYGKQGNITSADKIQALLGGGKKGAPYDAEYISMYEKYNKAKSKWSTSYDRQVGTTSKLMQQYQANPEKYGEAITGLDSNRFGNGDPTQLLNMIETMMQNASGKDEAGQWGINLNDEQKGMLATLTRINPLFAILVEQIGKTVIAFRQMDEIETKMGNRTGLSGDKSFTLKYREEKQKKAEEEVKAIPQETIDSEIKSNIKKIAYLKNTYDYREGSKAEAEGKEPPALVAGMYNKMKADIAKAESRNSLLAGEVLARREGGKTASAKDIAVAGMTDAERTAFEKKNTIEGKSTENKSINEQIADLKKRRSSTDDAQTIAGIDKQIGGLEEKKATNDAIIAKTKKEEQEAKNKAEREKMQDTAFKAIIEQSKDVTAIKGSLDKHLQITQVQAKFAGNILSFISNPKGGMFDISQSEADTVGNIV